MDIMNGHNKCAFMETLVTNVMREQSSGNFIKELKLIN